MFSAFSWQQVTSAFIVLFAVIDIIGAIPIIVSLREKGRNVNALKATLISSALLVGFFYVGDMVETGTTQQIFSDPHDQRLVDYLTGRFG